MTPKQLYFNTFPEKKDNDITILSGCYYNHIPELEDYNFESDKWNIKQDLIEFRYIKYFYYDSRRFWRLVTVWFDGKPVMIIRNAGREGDDHSSRFITDSELYDKMIMYIKGIMPISGVDTDVVKIDTDIPDLTIFYDQSLDGPFERYRY